VNLSWKLAEVLHERADSALLDTYEQERIPFARALIATTDRVFQFLVDEGRTPRLLRSQVAPRMLSLIARFAVTRRVMFKALSQIHISYHD
ncbi:FAD-dependent monooxygenase, partial [Mycobacterium kansasii]